MHMTEHTHVPERADAIFDTLSKYLMNCWSLLAKPKCRCAGDQSLDRASTAQAEVRKAAWTLNSRAARATRALQSSSAVKTGWTLDSTAASRAL